jgi:hypothetical protein
MMERTPTLLVLHRSKLHIKHDRLRSIAAARSRPKRGLLRPALPQGSNCDGGSNAAGAARRPASSRELSDGDTGTPDINIYIYEGASAGVLQGKTAAATAQTRQLASSRGRQRQRQQQPAHAPLNRKAGVDTPATRTGTSQPQGGSGRAGRSGTNQPQGGIRRAGRNPPEHRSTARREWARGPLKRQSTTRWD